MNWTKGKNKDSSGTTPHVARNLSSSVVAQKRLATQKKKREVAAIATLPSLLCISRLLSLSSNLLIVLGI